MRLCGWFMCGLSLLWLGLPTTLLTAVEPDVAARPLAEPPITADDRDHWAWLPLQYELPPGQPAAARTALDLFILAELAQHDLGFAAAADKASLLRRLKFDLHGLPPTVDELERFLQDKGADAYERLVDRLLADPAYGERWAQYWLDLARFAETDGFEHDKVRPDAWQYRDWVVAAFNADMPYDQFIRLQLAGDLLPAEQQSAGSIATMFCLAGPDMPDINEQDVRRHDKLNEITSTVGAVLLAMQMHCAQCHDHKYDPISQADFYRLRAVFEGAIPIMKRDAPVHYLAQQVEAVPARLYYRGEASQAGPLLPPGLPRVAVHPARSFICDPQTPRSALADWLFEADNPLPARVIANRIWQFHFGQSLTENPSDFGVVAAGPSHPELLDWLAAALRTGGWSLKALHRQILTSAVYRQAGRPPLGSESDTAAGNAGETEEPNRGGHAWAARLAADPENELYSRFPRKRLEGEVIRDSLLAVSDQLDCQRGGASVMPPLPDEMLGTLLKGQWKTSSRPADHARRSIYVFARRNLRYPIFDAFDRPDAGASCPLRDRSTTAIQSLQMLNSELTFTAARHLQQQLWSARQIDADATNLIDQLFLRTLSREPTPGERASLQQDLLNPHHPQLKQNLLTVCLALLNTNEFIYID